MLLGLEEKGDFKPMPETEGITWWKTKCSKAKGCLTVSSDTQLNLIVKRETSVTVNIPQFKGDEGENAGYNIDSSHLISEENVPGH